MTLACLLVPKVFHFLFIGLKTLGNCIEALQSVSENQPCDVIKIRYERRSGVENHFKKMDNPPFL